MLKLIKNKFLLRFYIEINLNQCINLNSVLRPQCPDLIYNTLTLLDLLETVELKTFY